MNAMIKVLLATASALLLLIMFTVEHGWEDESYTIYELKDSELHRLLETFGG